MHILRRRFAAGLITALVFATGCGTGNGGGGAGGSASEASSPGQERERKDAWRIDFVSESRESEALDAVAVSAEEGWAIVREGAASQAPSTAELLHRTDGGEWKPGPLPPGLDEHALAGVEVVLEASGPGNVWLFAEAYAARWDGTRWKSEPLDFRLTDAAVLAADDIWALERSPGEEPTARHWDGERWSSMPLPASATALSASGPEDVWAVGHQRDETGDTYSQPAAMHWDGREWTLTETPEYRYPEPRPPEESAGLDAVLSVSATETWAFGMHGYNHGEGGEEPPTEQIMLRWDGSRWTKAPAGVDGSVLMAPDGSGGLVLGAKLHWTGEGDGAAHRIRRPELITGHSERVTKADRTQKLWLEKLMHVPGTDRVWGVGKISVGARGDANFSRAVVVSHDAAH